MDVCYTNIGARIEVISGFINLIRMKLNYYPKIENILKKDILAALKQLPSLRVELFYKLYSLFNRYFTESGYIYFNSMLFYNNVYEKVYKEEKGVIFFWETQMLYYFKTNYSFKSFQVEFPSKRGMEAVDGQGFLRFYFDALQIETGEISNPIVETLEKTAKPHGVSVVELFKD
jgi:hypothetical protein